MSLFGDQLTLLAACDDTRAEPVSCVGDVKCPACACGYKNLGRLQKSNLQEWRNLARDDQGVVYHDESVFVKGC